MLIDRLISDVKVSPMALRAPSYAAADDFLGFAKVKVKLGQPTLNRASCPTCLRNHLSILLAQTP